MIGGDSRSVLRIDRTLWPATEVVCGVARLKVADSRVDRYAEQFIAEAFAGKRSRCGAIR